jgi:hypothetical protein
LPSFLSSYNNMTEGIVQRDYEYVQWIWEVDRRLSCYAVLVAQNSRSPYTVM